MTPAVIDPGHGQRRDRPGRVPGQLAALEADVGPAAADGRGQGRRVRARHAPLRRRGPGRPGRSWLGVATPAEALALRAAGDDGPAAGLAVRARGGPDPAGRGRRRRRRPSRSSRSPGWWPRPAPSSAPARVHLKVDTGLSRNGAAAARLARGLRGGGRGGAGRRASRSSGSGRTSPPRTSPGTRRSPIQLAAFDRAYEVARGRRAGAGAAAPGQLGRRPGRCPRPGWTWSGSASPRTGSIRRRASPRRPA